MASLVPEPTEKCTVWAASPTSTTFPCDQRSLRTVGKLRQRDRFLRIGCPRSSSAKSRSVKATVSSSGASAKPGAPPRLLGRLEDEGRPAIGIPVGVHSPEPVAVLLEDERERRERVRRPEPHEPVRPPVDVRAEVLGVERAHRAVHAVGRQDQVGVGVRREVGDLDLELELHAEVRATPLQEVEERLPGHPREAVPGRGHDRAAVVDLDVVPVGERADDLLVGLAVGLRESLEGRVGEHHAESEGVVRAVPLEDGDVVLGVGLLHERGEVESRRPAADADDLHRRASPGRRRPPSKAIVGRKRGRSNDAPLPLR